MKFVCKQQYKNAFSRSRVVAHKARIKSQDGLFGRDCTMIDVSGATLGSFLGASDPLPSQFLILSHNGAVRRLCQPVWQNEMQAGVRFIFK